MGKGRECVGGMQGKVGTHKQHAKHTSSTPYTLAAETRALSSLNTPTSRTILPAHTPASHCPALPDHLPATQPLPCTPPAATQPCSCTHPRSAQPRSPRPAAHLESNKELDALDLTSPVIRKAVQPAVIIMAMPKSCSGRGTKGRQSGPRGVESMRIGCSRL